MAATLAGAERMIEAAWQEAGVRMMVNWPVVWRAQVQAAVALANRPEFGRIWQITHRAGHGGPDVECSPYFREWILDPETQRGRGPGRDRVLLRGEPGQRAFGPARAGHRGILGHLREPDLPVEDNAIVIMSYARGRGHGGRLVGPDWAALDRIPGHDLGDPGAR